MHVAGRLADVPVETPTLGGAAHGLTRRRIVGREGGSVHQDVVVAELEPGGVIGIHLHAYEQALYVLGGELEMTAAGTVEPLVADDHVFIERGVAHGYRNVSDRTARWFEVSAPQPGGALQDTVVVTGEPPVIEVEHPYRKGHFDVESLPAPSATIGLAGFGNANVGGAALEILVGPATGSSQLNLMVVQYAPGGFITEHDHAFEEAFFFLTGEIEALLDGETKILGAGDYCWSAVGSMHALTNRSDQPVRWLETQTPQPPSRHQARFIADWQRLTSA